MIARSLLLPFLFVSSLLAADEKPAPARQFRLMAVGESPPFQQEVRDGVRYEREPPAGSIPPREVTYGVEGEPTATTATALRLGRISDPLKAPAGKGPLLLRKRDAAQDSEPWMRLTCPETGDFLVLLWRDLQHGSWEKAHALVLADDPVTAPAGTLRIVNIAPVTVRIVIGNEKLILEAGKSIRRLLPAAQEQPFEVYLGGTDGSPKRLFSSQLMHQAGERGLAIIYQADGIASRRPLKVAVQREPAPRGVPQ
jgi:hypothetical protein